MKVVVTGAAGFVGARLADLLLGAESPLPVSELVLTDAVEPAARTDTRVRSFALDLTAPAAAASLLDGHDDTSVLFHLAAVVSGHAEADFDFGMAVNFDATRALLEAVRARSPAARFVFASTVGVFGGALPPTVNESTVVTPETSYGAAKAAAELLVQEYTRRGFVDGRVARLPTVSVRAGAPNAAVTSFASGLVREPLNGLKAAVPVPPEQELWLASPRTTVRNLARLAALPAEAMGARRVVHLPGLRVSVRDMVAALRVEAGDRVAARVDYRVDEQIARMVASFPVQFDNARALDLGLQVDASFADIIKIYIREDLRK